MNEGRHPHHPPLNDPGCEPHEPELYSPARAAETIPTLEDVNGQALGFYRTHGYLAVDQALTSDEVQATLDVAQELSANGWDGISYEANKRDSGKKAVRKLAFFGEEARECGLLVDHTGLLKAVKVLLGGKVPDLFQTMMLLKPAHVGREKPWHQDHAYFDVDLRDRIVGVWIALDEATVENGCMQVLDRGHELGPILHWRRRDWQICDSDVMGKKSVSVPLKPGGLLFFDSLLPHGTPSNNSPYPRRAIQLHFAPAGSRDVPESQRLAIFGSEGKNVTC